MLILHLVLTRNIVAPPISILLGRTHPPCPDLVTEATYLIWSLI